MDSSRRPRQVRDARTQLLSNTTHDVLIQKRVARLARPRRRDAVVPPQISRRNSRNVDADLALELLETAPLERRAVARVAR